METAAQRTATLLINVVSPSLFCWEYLNTLEAEVMLYRRRRLHLITVLWIVIRYGAVVAAVVSYCLIAGLKTNLATCKAFAILPYIMFLLINLAASALFTLRTYAIWERNKVVLGGLIFLICLQIPPAIVDVTVGTEIFVSPAAGICFQTLKFHPDPSLFFYLACFLTDAAVVVLSSYKLLQKRRMTGMWTPVIKMLLKDGLAYFIVVDVFHFANLILFAIGGQFQSQVLTSPDLFVTAILAQRVVIHHLKDFSFGSVVFSSSGGMHRTPHTTIVKTYSENVPQAPSTPYLLHGSAGGRQYGSGGWDPERETDDRPGTGGSSKKATPFGSTRDPPPMPLDVELGDQFSSPRTVEWLSDRDQPFAYQR